MYCLLAEDFQIISTCNQDDRCVVSLFARLWGWRTVMFPLSGIYMDTNSIQDNGLCGTL